MTKPALSVADEGSVDSNCEEYGRLYTWEAAKRACESLGKGWRLPTDEEWKVLANSVGGYYDYETNKNVGDPQMAFEPGLLTCTVKNETQIVVVMPVVGSSLLTEHQPEGTTTFSAIISLPHSPQHHFVPRRQETTTRA